MSTKMILLCLIGWLTIVTCKPHTDDHFSPEEDAHDSDEDDVSVARVLQLSYDTEEGEGRSFQHEEPQPNGGEKGSFGYRDKNGDLIVRFYVVDENGYRIVKDERYPSLRRAGDGYYDKENGKGFYDGNQAPHIPDSRNSDNFLNRDFRPNIRSYPEDFFDRNVRPNLRSYPEEYFGRNVRPNSRNYPENFVDRNATPNSRNYPEIFFDRNARPDSRNYPENFVDRNARPDLRNYPENFFDRNARPDSRNYQNNDRVNSSLVGFYPLRVKPGPRDSVDRQGFGDRPFSISGITRSGNGFFDDPYNPFPPQLPVKNPLSNIPQPYNGFVGLISNYRPFGTNYNRAVPFRDIQGNLDPADYSRKHFGNYRTGNPDGYTTDDTKSGNVDQIFNRDFKDSPLTLGAEGPNPPQRIPTAAITGVKLVPGGIVPLYNVPIEPKPKPYRPFTAYPTLRENDNLNQHPEIFPTSFSRPNSQSETDKAFLLTNQQPTDESVFSEQSAVNSSTSNRYKMNPDFQTRKKVLNSRFKPFYSSNFSQFQTRNNAIQKSSDPNLHVTQHLLRPRFGFSNIYGTTL